jgi:hypothetical protein
MGSEVAEADQFMELSVGQFKKPSGFPIGVVPHPRCAQDRIAEGDGNRRPVATHGGPYFIRLIFGFSKCRKGSIGVELKNLGPPLEPLAAGHLEVGIAAIYPGDSPQLVDCTLLHYGLLFEQNRCPSPNL